MNCRLERCIRDREGRICAWTVGMTDDDIRAFLEKYEGTYLSSERVLV